MPRFHLAFPVADKEATRAFFVEVLGCGVGREAERWIDFDLHGHQLSAHVAPEALSEPGTNPVDGDLVPVRHFGLILEWGEWHALRDALRARGTEFLIAPHLRFAGEVGEQMTMFFRDPSGNVIEIKSFREDADVFRRS